MPLPPNPLLAGAEESLPPRVTLSKPEEGFPHLFVSLHNPCLMSLTAQLAAAFQLSSPARGASFCPKAPAKAKGGDWEGTGAFQLF